MGIPQTLLLLFEQRCFHTQTSGTTPNYAAEEEQRIGGVKRRESRTAYISTERGELGCRGPESAKVYSPAPGQRCPATEYSNTKRCAPCYEQVRNCVCQLHHISRRGKSTRQRQENRHAQRCIRCNDRAGIRVLSPPPRGRSHQ